MDFKKRLLNVLQLLAKENGLFLKKIKTIEEFSLNNFDAEITEYDTYILSSDPSTEEITKIFQGSNKIFYKRGKKIQAPKKYIAFTCINKLVKHLESKTGKRLHIKY